MKPAALLSAALLLAACLAPTVETTASAVPPTAAELALVETYVTGRLRDPDSARFRNLIAYALGTGDRAICGEVNAKNAFGGYVGFQAFYVRLRGTAIVQAFVGDEEAPIAAAGCREAAAGTLRVREG